MKWIENSICAPTGFLASGIHVGIKKKIEKLDLALIFSQVPATAAGVFTLNKAKAAPVVLTQKHLKNGIFQAIIINSGNANACTGKIGDEHAYAMCAETAFKCDIPIERVAVASTGVIGVTLEIEKILAGIYPAVKKLSSKDKDAAMAIMTTDTYVKSCALEITCAKHQIKIGGIAKGSGMIHPNMATMLGFITTDIDIEQSLLQKALNEINEKTFNAISVDGDSSTNDMLIVLANGLAKNKKIQDETSDEYIQFKLGLHAVCHNLSQQIIYDGEGATKVFEVFVTGAYHEADAKKAARAVTLSPLVKTAIHGEDANWGRIASAVGASGIDFSLNLMSISIGKNILFSNGLPVKFSEEILKIILKEKTILIEIDLNQGHGSAKAWGCDLSADYIKINTSYRS